MSKIEYPSGVKIETREGTILAPGPAYKRRPPPAVVQWATGFWIYGLARPAVWTLETFGCAEGILGNMSVWRKRQLEKRNPLRNYAPGKQDVFVMTYAKSGTNWLMQIAHQLI